jgi:hypothetical protein
MYTYVAIDQWDHILTSEEVMYVASAHYNWLIVNWPSFRTNSSGVALVAVLWDPATKKTYASTIPRGQFRAMMMADISRKPPIAAPVWATVMQRGGVSTLHAEDACYFLYETANPQPKGATTFASTDLFIAAYGSQKLKDGTVHRLAIISALAGARKARSPASQIAARWQKLWAWGSRPC